MAKALLLDLDGTLLDTAPDFYICLNAVLDEAGYPLVDRAACRATVSNGSRALVTLGTGLREGDAGFTEFLDALLARYAEHSTVDTVVFDGFTEVFEACLERGIAWGVVTNKPVLYAEPVMNAFQFPLAPALLICPDHVTQTKPHPEPLLLAAQRLALAPEDCLYVGDHRRDIESGRAAGMKTVGVRYGYVDDNDPPEAWGADWIIDEAHELLRLLDK